MDLHEEYIKRHSLSVPVVKYSGNTYLILKANAAPYKWRVLNFKWNAIEWRPGYFIRRYMAPKHDGWSKDHYFQDILPPKNILWDEYENYILKDPDFISRIRAEEVSVVKSGKWAAAWEMFVYIHDSWLADYARTHSGFSKVLAASLRNDLEDSVRKEFFRSALKTIEKTNRAIVDNFNYKVLPIAKSDGNWLAELIDG